MERNCLTTVAALRIGDRFFKLSDKKRLVLELVQGETKRTHFQTYKHFCCPVSIMDNNRMPAQLKERNFKAINKDTQVIFLRNKEDK